MPPKERSPIKGRGSHSNPAGRFATRTTEPDETESYFDDEPRHPHTCVREETAKSLITRNQSPDVPFNLSINPYRGCEQGCVYCFARPTHSYLDLSPGLDFETRIFAKTNAPELFEKELSRPKYHCEPIALGINTDAYQPAERELEITRQLLEVALKFRQPISIITKSGLILRDRDLLAEMAHLNLIQVAVSLTTLDNNLKRIMEPRAASPAMRLKVIRTLTQAGIPVSTLLAPIVPLINEPEIEALLDAATEAGSTSAAYILLRLPHELGPLFCEWLGAHFPERAQHVLSRLNAMRNGKLYESGFGKRMRGEGIFADLIRQRFDQALRRNGLHNRREYSLNCDQFSPPQKRAQLALW